MEGRPRLGNTQIEDKASTFAMETWRLFSVWEGNVYFLVDSRAYNYIFFYSFLLYIFVCLSYIVCILGAKIIPSNLLI